MDGEIEIMEYPAVRELVARLERERDEARAAHGALWTEVSTGQIYARLQACIAVFSAALQRIIRDTDDELARRYARRALEQDAAAPEATPPDDGR